MILIIDFGSQTAHLIGRRLRQLGVTIKYVYPEEINKQLRDGKGFTPHISMVRGIIFSGGPAFVNEKGSPTISKKVFDLGIPILAICYGWQLMAYLLDGKVETKYKEFGPETIHFHKTTGIFSLPEKEFTVIMSHGDSITKLPSGFEVMGSTKQVPYAAVSNEQKRFYGVLFHPEADHTEYGLEILKHFAHDVCGEPLLPLVLDPQQIIKEIQAMVGNKKVIYAVSGGVDSTVAAFLTGKAIGKNLIPVYADSGLMRPETDKRVQYIFTKLINANLVIVDGRKRFLKALRGITDPEEKRKAIGKLYIDIFEEEAKKHKGTTLLGQGTIYSDVIESKGSRHASHIKSHHNVGGLPKELNLQLLEPLRNYYKDEVRELGRLAGLPEDIVNQQPFPGPGFAVRIRGEVTEERLKQVKQADAIVLEELKKAELYHKVFQSFAIMTGSYSTAVKGDGRVFAEVVGVRIIESHDIMTAQWLHAPYDVLAQISSRIVNEVPHVSRVVYDITTKPPATMEWE